MARKGKNPDLGVQREFVREIVERFVPKNNQITFILDTRNRIVYCTEAAAKICGSSCKEITNQKFPYSLTSPTFQITKNRRKVSYSISQIIYRHRSGKYKLLLLSKIPHEATVRKKQIENHNKILKETEDNYRGLFNAVREAIYVQDKEGKFLDVNDGAVRMYGYPREFFIGKTPEFLSAPGYNDMSKIFQYVVEAFTGKSQQFEFWGKKSNGEVFPKRVSLTLGKYMSKDAIIAVAEDITETKKSNSLREALFQISEAAYTASDMYSLYKKIHDVIATLMKVKNIYIALYDDKSGILSFPYWVDEYDPPLPPKKLGRGLTEYVLRTGEAVLVDLEKDIELRRTGEIELVGSQSSIWLGVPLKITGKTIGVIVVQDYENEKAYGEQEMQILIFVSEQIAQVIERKRNAEAVNKYSEELRLINQTKDKFFSIIAHDLKNPFVTILGFSDLLLSDFYELEDEEKLFYVREMKNSAELSHNLLQNLLQWSRSQTGRMEFNPQSLSLSYIIDEIIKLLHIAAEKKCIELRSDINSDLHVMADEDMLNTIIRNLLTNAIKFTQNEGKISISAEPYDKFIRVEVMDTGIGMDKRTLSNLFKIDTAHSRMGTADESGTGLGLILCKEFIDRHGGKIWVESVEGKGSKFIFLLPTNNNQ